MSRIPLVLILFIMTFNFARESNAGYLTAQSPYFAHPGAPLIHGFGSPLVQPFVFNHFYTQPILKAFFAPQPFFYHPQPQFIPLPTPQFYSLPQTVASASAPSNEYGPPATAPTAKEQQQLESTGYDASAPSASHNQFKSSPSRFGADSSNQKDTSGSSNPGSNHRSQDKTRGVNNESISVNAEDSSNQSEHNRFGSFIVNSGDNSIRTGFEPMRERERQEAGNRPTSGYA